MQVIVIAVAFAILGVILGLLSPLAIPISYARYTAVALLAALDSIFGAFKAYIAGTFEPRVLFSGLITNMALAGGLTFFGDKLASAARGRPRPFSMSELAKRMPGFGASAGTMSGALAYLAVPAVGGDPAVRAGLNHKS